MKPEVRSGCGKRAGSLKNDNGLLGRDGNGIERTKKEEEEKEKEEKKEGKEKKNDEKKKRRKETSHPRIAHGQRYPMPCLE